MIEQGLSFGNERQDARVVIGAAGIFDQRDKRFTHGSATSAHADLQELGSSRARSRRPAEPVGALILLGHEHKWDGDHQDQPNPTRPLQQIYFFHGKLLVWEKHRHCERFSAKQFLCNQQVASAKDASQ
jgi:hypothetical protein